MCFLNLLWLNFVWFGWHRKFPGSFEINKAVKPKELFHLVVEMNIFWNVFGSPGTGSTLVLITSLLFHDIGCCKRSRWHCTKKWSFPLGISSVNASKSAVFLRIWSHLLRKSLIENFIFCAVWISYIMLSSDMKITYQSK